MKTNKKADGRYFQLNLSLTAAELDNIKQRAEALGLRPVHFARLAVMNENPALPSTLTRETQALKQLRLQLSRVGNLLNQLVRRFHQSNLPPPADLAPLLQDIRVLIARMPR